jgi:hypothetical protein
MLWVWFQFHEINRLNLIIERISNYNKDRRNADEVNDIAIRMRAGWSLGLTKGAHVAKKHEGNNKYHSKNGLKDYHLIVLRSTHALGETGEAHYK